MWVLGMNELLWERIGVEHGTAGGGLDGDGLVKSPLELLRSKRPGRLALTALGL